MIDFCRAALLLAVRYPRLCGPLAAEQRRRDALRRLAVPVPRGGANHQTVHDEKERESARSRTAQCLPLAADDARNTQLHVHSGFFSTTTISSRDLSMYLSAFFPIVGQRFIHPLSNIFTISCKTNCYFEAENIVGFFFSKPKLE